MLVNTERLTPVYLRDLKPELRNDYMADIQIDPVLRQAYANGDPIIVGWYAPALHVDE